MKIIAFDPSKNTGFFMASTCQAPSCPKLAAKRGYCIAHYERMKRHGDPLGGGTADGDLIKFIEDVVLPYEGDECIIWPYGRGGKGYAYMTADGKHQPTHRYICQRVHGAPPTPEHEAAHSCGRGFDACVNKNHLAWKTPTENASDKEFHGTVNRGERNGSAKLTESDVMAIFSMKGTASQAAIAARFGVSRSTVGLIHNGQKWSWLTGKAMAS